MRSIRVKKEGVYCKVDALIEAGYEAREDRSAMAKGFCGGCADPRCCAQHPCLEEMTAIVTSASGHEFHRLMRRLYLV